MTRYGPWIQPEDTEAAPLVIWYAVTAPSQGNNADRTDAAQFAASVATALAGTGTSPPPSPIITSLTTTAAAAQTEATHIDFTGNDSAAVARLTLLAPKIDQLSYPPVVPVELPNGAVDAELETPEGVPVDGTLRIFGYSVTSAASAGSTNQAGVTLKRLFPGSYTLDGLGRPQSTWSQALAGSTVETFAPPILTGTYDVAAFEVASQSLDVNGFAVYTMVDDFLNSSWLYGEASSGQIRNAVPLAPPSAGTLPWFTQTYTPPRYRFVYDEIAPLRQYPRDDGLAFGSVQRAFPRPGSIQRGPRQRIGGYA